MTAPPPLQGQRTYGNTVGDDDHIVPKRLLLEEKLAFARNEQMTDVV